MDNGTVKALKLHTNPRGAYLAIDVGDTFVILEEDELRYFVEIDGMLMAFTKDADDFGKSYKDWFDLVE